MAAKLRAAPPRITTHDTRRVTLPPKRVDPFYLSAEYQAWREIVIGRSGGRCQDPACRTPNRRPPRLFADHIRERRDGGAPFDPANGLARCGACHTRKTLAERAARLAR